MINLLYKQCLWLTKHKYMYYILNYSWGLLTTLIGWIIILVLACCGFKIKRIKGNFYAEVGDFWGGFEMGTCFVRDKSSSDSLTYHEIGHTYQNAILGPFYLIIIGIPSAIRYWHRELHYYRKHKVPKTEYDSIWFEGMATNIGNLIK